MPIRQSELTPYIIYAAKKLKINLEISEKFITLLSTMQDGERNQRSHCLRKVKDSRTEQEQQEAFLEAFLSCAKVTEACSASKVMYYKVLNWRHFDPVFKEAYDFACDQISQILEDEAIRRAVYGIDKPVYFKGEVVGQIKHYSDNLLIFLMKGWMPDKYRDRLHIEKNVNTNNTVLVMPSNGRELNVTDKNLEYPSKATGVAQRGAPIVTHRENRAPEYIQSENVQDESIPNVTINKSEEKESNEGFNLQW